MNKKVIAILLSVLLVFTLVGCGSDKKEETDKNDTHVTEQTNKNKLDKFKEELKAKGHDVGENETLAYDMLGATNGYKFKVDGELIEIYEYDEKKLSEDGKKKLEEAKKGSINMSGINVPVKYNNYLVLARSEKHSKASEIVDIFNNL